MGQLQVNHLVCRNEVMIGMSNMQETALAWTMVEAVKPYLSARHRNRAFVAVGAGDTFSVIQTLLKLASTKRIPLPAELLQQSVDWLDSYGLREEVQPLPPCSDI